MQLNDRVKDYWEAEPCGTNPVLTGNAPAGSRAWYEAIEAHRYRVEPFIHAVAQFTRAHGKRVLEVGVGAGTDHLQWARAGAQCWGVDLTDAAIETTRKRLDLYGLTSRLQRVDAEQLPFEDGTFDIVYSWGVIHHSERPEAIIAEIRRVLRPGGMFIGMLYHRPALNSWQLWARHALLRGKPWRSLRDVLWHHLESVGTKAYSRKELLGLFSAFAPVSVKPLLTPYDVAHIPRWVHRFFPDDWGFFAAVHAHRQ